MSAFNGRSKKQTVPRHVTNMPGDPKAYQSHRKDFGQNMVNLVVGEAERVFTVHEALLRRHSTFFESATKEVWTKNEVKPIPLPEDEPDVVDLYIQWIYTSRLPIRRPRDEVEDNRETSVLIDAFIFGEKVQDGGFKDATIDAIIRAVDTPAKDGKKYYPGIEKLDRAYKGTTSGSPLRRLLIDMYVYRANRDWLSKVYNCELLLDLAQELVDVREKPSGANPTAGGVCSCSYHHHCKDDLCYSRNKDEEADLLALL